MTEKKCEPLYLEATNKSLVMLKCVIFYTPVLQICIMLHAPAYFEF